VQNINRRNKIPGQFFNLVLTGLVFLVSGRGLPISSLASSVVKMQLVKNEKDKTETFLFASDKFGVYVLSLNFVGKTSLSIK
jgi:hypothetical protein